MQKFRNIAFLFLFWASTASVVQADPLVIYTETYPPFNFLDEDGVVAGLATEKVRQVMDATGLDYTIKLTTWARALHFATTQDNALIYTLTRTPGRDPEFDWLVPLAPSNFYLFVRADEQRPVTLETIRSGMFRATCVSNDLGCELIRWTGIPEKNIITVFDNDTADFMMVIAGRADIYISDIAVNGLLRKSQGFNPAMTKPVLRLQGKTGFYLAAGMQVPENIRGQIMRAHQTLADEGDYEMIRTATGPEG